MNPDIRISLNGKTGLYRIIRQEPDKIYIHALNNPTETSVLVLNAKGNWVVFGSRQPYVIEFLSRNFGYWMALPSDQLTGEPQFIYIGPEEEFDYVEPGDNIMEEVD